MDIPNLSNTPPVIPTPETPKKNNLISVFIFIIIGISAGFWLSRILPAKYSITDSTTSPESNQALSAETITGQEDIKINSIYGDTQKIFKDSATGILQKGGINGEGTHYLDREGGVTQRAALTSSVLDLDLFVGRQVEIKGETNTSNKAGWLLDVGSIKVLE